MNGIPQFRIVSNDIRGQETQVFFVDRDGGETEVSNAITSATITVGQLNRVRIEGYVGSYDIRAAVAKGASATWRRALRWTLYRRGPYWQPQPRALTCAALDVAACARRWREYLPLPR